MRDEVPEIRQYYKYRITTKSGDDIMAVSASRLSSDLRDFIMSRYQLDRCEVSRDIPGMDGLQITISKGDKRGGFIISGSQFDDFSNLIREVDTRMTQLIKQITNRIDMRYNNIEDMNDFLTLVSRQQESNPGVDTVILTPEQVQTLIVDTMVAEGRPDLIGQPIMTLYGYKVDTQEQD